MALYKVDSDTAELTKVAGGTLYADAPIGTISPFGGSVIPNGYLLCNGDEVLKTDYADLYTVIGDSFGTASANTKFKLPDLRGEFLRGAGTNSHTNQGDGGTVGEHQNGTLNKYIEGVSGDQIRVPVADTSDFDKLIISTAQVIYSNGTTAQTSNGKYGTTRPTNTSVNYIIKAKHTPVPADFTDSLIGYLGQETNYNLYPWSHTRTQDGEDISTDIIVERDGWYSIDYTLTNSTDTNHTFTLRDFDGQGEVHTVMRCHYGKSGTFRQTYLVPLKAGTYRYSHGGIGSLSVYMNRRDFA